MAVANVKPCPFCGSLPRIERNNSTKKFWICCDNPKCAIHPSTDMHLSLAVIAREWNRRVNDG